MATRHADLRQQVIPVSGDVPMTDWTEQAGGHDSASRLSKVPYLPLPSCSLHILYGSHLARRTGAQNPEVGSWPPRQSVHPAIRHRVYKDTALHVISLTYTN